MEIAKATLTKAEDEKPKQWEIHITPKCFDTFGNPDKYAQCPACGFKWGELYDVKTIFRHCPGCGLKLQGTVEK